MKNVQLSELGALAADVRKGETVAVYDGDEVIAKLVPNVRQTLEERIDELVAQGKVDADLELCLIRSSRTRFRSSNQGACSTNF